MATRKRTKGKTKTNKILYNQKINDWSKRTPL